MATRKLLLYFEKRRKSKTLSLAQQQILRSINTVSVLTEGLEALSKNERNEAEAALQRLFTQEVEIDGLRRAVFEELSGDSLPMKYREDLKELVGHLDVMADHVKDAARSVRILLETTVSKDLLDKFIGMARYLSACTTTLGECIELLGFDPAMAREYASKVDELEEQVDAEYLNAKMLLLKCSEETDAAALLELRDLMNHMEYVADTCADTAESIRVLATEEVE